ncbi:hypothetical protein B0H10DRAFT_1942091 [Mycena sp. CBHHK59/15]|nr:hypothetical protein B0H10DRAFT_1942091 [Mycena sp. CBHHK59/15]
MPVADISRHSASIGAPLGDIVTQGQAFQATCKAVGSTRSKKTAWIAHLLGGKNACPHTSAEAKADATAQRKEIQSNKWPHPDTPDAVAEPAQKKHQQQPTLTQSTLMAFRKNNMPYSDSEVAVLQRQALCAIISSGFPLNVFEDPEMLILFGMLRTTAPTIMPTGKVVGGRLLTSAATEVEDKVAKALKNRNAGLSTDAWKRQKRDAVKALCSNVDFKVTALNKDGPSLCDLFADMIDRVEEKYGCVIIYFTTDADGGSKTGRILLGKKQPWLILPSCWAHQFQLIPGDYFKVNNMAAGIAEEATALIAWINNHGKLAVLQKRSAIIAAEVGAAMLTEGDCLKEDADRFCALIEDASFWNGLETVLGDLEPICLGTNINQKDSTHLDQVFLMITDHPEEEVKTCMLIRLEKRWKDCDQHVFLAALILNPFQKLSCFGPNTNLNHFKCLNMLIVAHTKQLFCRMKGRPGNEDTPEQKKTKETEVSKAFKQYLTGTGDFGDFDSAEWETTFVSMLMAPGMF